MADLQNNFRTVFKKLKCRNPVPDYKEVIDFTKEISTRTPLCLDLNSTELNCDICTELGLKQHSLWELFDINQVPGLIFIPNPFTPDGQRHWIKQCLEEYTQPPNITNLGQCADLWRAYCEGEAENRRKLWKLRWATLGYHHDWDTKVYSEEKCGPFPACLSRLTQHTADVLGLRIQPQAAIINFYHLDSTLSGHTDHSEFDQSAPLLSFSFGCKAIFMIGGEDKSVHPVSMFVRSGDVIVMSGKSRLCYHAVPKICSREMDDQCPWNDWGPWEHYDLYLNESRINMNVRQVF